MAATTMVELLLAAGAVVDARNGDGATSLIAAAQSGREAVVRLLLEHKADPSAAMQMGWTPLHAANNCPPEKALTVAKLLLDAGAAINATNSDGDTALIMTASSGRFDVVRLLLDSKADIQAASKAGLTGLFMASMNGHIDVVRLLLDSKANVNLAGQQTTVTIMVPKHVTTTIQEPKQVTHTVMEKKQVSVTVVEGGEVKCLRRCFWDCRCIC